MELIVNGMGQLKIPNISPPSFAVEQIIKANFSKKNWGSTDVSTELERPRYGQSTGPVYKFP
jgi:hypothetical protein